TSTSLIASGPPNSLIWIARGMKTPAGMLRPQLKANPRPRSRRGHAMMRRMREVDLFVIGGGSGGVRAARIAAGHGASVVLAEEHRVGGTCVIRGCVPKKLMVYASRFAQEFEEAAAYGWHIDGEPHLDWPTLKAHRD